MAEQRSTGCELFDRSGKVAVVTGGRRAGAPEEVVGAALYFASDASRYTTGAILKIDGGAVHPAA